MWPMKISILNGSFPPCGPPLWGSFASLSFMWLASLGSFACLNCGLCTLFLFLFLSWVLSFYKVWQVFIIIMVLCHVIHIKDWKKRKRKRDNTLGFLCWGRSLKLHLQTQRPLFTCRIMPEWGVLEINACWRWNTFSYLLYPIDLLFEKRKSAQKRASNRCTAF